MSQLEINENSSKFSWQISNTLGLKWYGNLSEAGLYERSASINSNQFSANAKKQRFCLQEVTPTEGSFSLG